MTKTYKKRKQKRGGAGFIPVNCDYLKAKKCNNDNRDERLKTRCSDEEREKYIMYCCDSHTDKQMEEFIAALKEYIDSPGESGLARVKSRRRRRSSSRRRRRRPKRGRSAKR